MSRYQKGKTYLDFTELRDSEWHWYVYCVRQLLEYNFPIWSPRYVYLKHTHTQPFNGLWSGTTRVGQYQKKHSPTHTHTDHRTSVIIFLHLQQSMASTLFILRAWQSSHTTSLQVLFSLPLSLRPSTSYSVHFFTQSSSLRSTCPYQRSLFCCNTSAMSSIPSLPVSTPYLEVCLLA